MRRKLFLCLLSLTAATVAFGPARAQGAFNKAVFDDLMDDSVKHARVFLSALIGADWDKAEGEAKTLQAQAKQLRELTPKEHPDRLAQFQAGADTLGARAVRLEGAVKAHDPGKASLLFGQVVETCTGCHQAFRK